MPCIHDISAFDCGYDRTSCFNVCHLDCNLELLAKINPFSPKLLFVRVIFFSIRGRKDKTGENTQLNSCWRSKEEQSLGEGHGGKEKQEQVVG